MPAKAPDHGIAIKAAEGTGYRSAAMTLARGAALAWVACVLLACGAGADEPTSLDRPLSVVVKAAPPTADPATRKATEDSSEDVRRALAKRKNWFAVVADPDQADIVIEVVERGQEPSYGYVLHPRYSILDLYTNRLILGQGGLNTRQVIGLWSTAATDLTLRLQNVCEKVLPDIMKPWRRVARPMAVSAVGRGDTATNEGRNEQALEEYATAIRIAPEYARAHFNRGLLYVKVGDYDKAIADFSEVIRLRPTDARAYSNRSLAYSKKGLRTQAEADKAKARELSPPK
jgi:tetratricopeptide (TPR) repeat protein